MKIIKNLGLLFLIIILALFLSNFIRKQPKLTEVNSVPVYFVKVISTGEQIISVKRKLEPGEKRISASIKELLKGPSQTEKESGYFTEIPNKTALLDIKENSDKVTINLSKDFELGGGSESMATRLHQITYTALDSTKKPVYLELDGQKVEYIGGEGLEVHQPLIRK